MVILSHPGAAWELMMANLLPLPVEWLLMVMAICMLQRKAGFKNLRQMENLSGNGDNMGMGMENLVVAQAIALYSNGDAQPGN